MANNSPTIKYKAYLPYQNNHPYPSQAINSSPALLFRTKSEKHFPNFSFAPKSRRNNKIRPKRFPLRPDFFNLSTHDNDKREQIKTYSRISTIP